MYLTYIPYGELEVLFKKKINKSEWHVHNNILIHMCTRLRRARNDPKNNIMLDKISNREKTGNTIRESGVYDASTGDFPFFFFLAFFSFSFRFS